MTGKAVMISIHPEWCSLISQGKKTVEVRKTRTKMGGPFKCYIYESRGDTKEGNEIFNVHLKGSGRMAVIGEFVCNMIVYLGNISTDPWERLLGDIHEWQKQLVTQYACLTEDELHQYGGQYAWFISDLVIYDKPKQLSEFYKKCKSYDKDEWDIDNLDCIECKNPCGNGGKLYLKRPPQSWCYVVEG